MSAEAISEHPITRKERPEEARPDEVAARGVDAFRALSRHGRRPVIMQVLPEMESGGVERGTIDMAAAIAEAGGEAIVASAGGRMTTRLARLGGGHAARHLTMPLASKRPGTLLANRYRLSLAIREHGVDLVHARSRAPAWSARFAAHGERIPFVTTYHGAYNEGLPGKRLYNSVMASGDRVIAISEFVRDLILDRHDTPEDLIRVVPRGVDLDVFDPARIGGGRILRTLEGWRLPEDARVVLLPGRITRWKGQRVFIDAMAEVLRELSVDDVYAVVLGDARGREDYANELVMAAKKRRITDRLVFANHSDDMPGAYMVADCVVSASTDPEAFGRVMAEAGAMGVPVVASNHGGAREILVEGVTGWFHEPGNASELATGILRALAMTTAERERLAGDARVRTSMRFSKTAMTGATLGVYAELLGGR